MAPLPSSTTLPRPIVLVEEDPPLRKRLVDVLMHSSRIVRAYSSVSEASAQLDPGSIDALLVTLRSEGQPVQQALSDSGAADADQASPESAPAGIGETAAGIREAACWIRQCANAHSPAPLLLAIDPGGASAQLHLSALHRGAAGILQARDDALLCESVEAQLRAFSAIQGAAVHAAGSGQAPVLNGNSASGHGARGNGYSVHEPQGGPAAASSSGSVRDIMLTPRARPDAEDPLGPGWVPTPADFSITESDPIDLKVYERKAVLRAIAAADGNRTLAAQLLGIGKSTLYRRLSEWRSEGA